MWIMHPSFGFLSVVQKAEDPSHILTVRARSRNHLEEFLHPFDDEYPVIEGAGTDYAFRAKVPLSVVREKMIHAVENIDYSNFKDECKKRGQPKSWLRRLANIWREHFQFQQQGG